MSSEEHQRYLARRMKQLWVGVAVVVAAAIVANVYVSSPVAGFAGALLAGSVITKPPEKLFKLGDFWRTTEVQQEIKDKMGGFIGGIVNAAAPRMANLQSVQFKDVGFFRLAQPLRLDLPGSFVACGKSPVVGTCFGWYSVGELIGPLIVLSVVLYSMVVKDALLNIW